MAFIIGTNIGDNSCSDLPFIELSETMVENSILYLQISMIYIQAVDERNIRCGSCQNDWVISKYNSIDSFNTGIIFMLLQSYDLGVYIIYIFKYLLHTYVANALFHVT